MIVTKVQAQRKFKKLTIDELSKATGVSCQTIRNFEDIDYLNNNRIPNLVKLMKIAKILELPIHKLIYNDEEEQ